MPLFSSRPTPGSESTVETRSVSTLVDARGMRPVDYVLPPASDLDREIVSRLTSLLNAGALDAENLGALDEFLYSEEERTYHLLDAQRTAHQQVCADILAVARANVVEAERALEGALERRASAEDAAIESRSRMSVLGLRHTVDA